VRGGGRGGHGWSLTDHVCIECMHGAILTKIGLDGLPQSMCSCCRAKAKNGDVKELCWCGATFSDVKRGPGKRKGASMGFRCVKNPNRGPQCPLYIVAAEIPAPRRQNVVDVATAIQNHKSITARKDAPAPDTLPLFGGV